MIVNTLLPKLDSKKESIELCVIINSFNRLELLRGSLSSVSECLNEVYSDQFGIIIFDAGSTDGSIEFITEFAHQNQDFLLILLQPQSDQDSSFSFGCNTAIKMSAEIFINLKWCLLFETDNYINNPKAISLAVKLLEQEKQLAGVGFTLEGAGFGASFPTAFSFVLGQQLSKYLSLSEMNIKTRYPFAGTQWEYSEVVFTSPILIRYSAWQETEGMDANRFPFSDCDTDWCWTINKKGWRLAVLDVSGVIHDNKMIASEWSNKRVLNYHQSRLQLLLKHRGDWILWLKPILFIRHCLEYSILSVKALSSAHAKKSLETRKILLRKVFNNYQ